MTLEKVNGEEKRTPSYLRCAVDDFPGPDGSRGAVFVYRRKKPRPGYGPFYFRVAREGRWYTFTSLPRGLTRRQKEQLRVYDWANLQALGYPKRCEGHLRVHQDGRVEVLLLMAWNTSLVATGTHTGLPDVLGLEPGTHRTDDLELCRTAARKLKQMATCRRQRQAAKRVLAALDNPLQAVRELLKLRRERRLNGKCPSQPVN